MKDLTLLTCIQLAVRWPDMYLYLQLGTIP